MALVFRKRLGEQDLWAGQTAETPHDAPCAPSAKHCRFAAPYGAVDAMTGYRTGSKRRLVDPADRTDRCVNKQWTKRDEHPAVELDSGIDVASRA